MAAGPALPLSRRLRNSLKWVGALAIVAVLVLLGKELLYPYPVGPKQPLPFSHAIHVNVRGINCIFCHDGADRSANAGIPAVGKCMLCHQYIITQFEPIQQLTAYYNEQRPIPWVRVNKLPDHVHFTHEMHLNAGVDCSQCHGNVRQMDRILQVQQFNMGFCVNCHWENDAPTECFNCHY